jgi:hypothetical protein
MEKEFIPYEQALELKEIGFDEPCLKYWDGIGKYFDQKDWFDWNQTEYFVSIPLYQQAFRWFRDRYNIDGFVRIEPLNEKYGFVIYNREKDNFKEFSAEYTSVEDAELECLKEMIYFLYNKI